MPDNIDSIMVVRRHVSGNVPTGWTKIVGKDLIARRVSWPDYMKLHVNAGNGANPMKGVAVHVFRKNSSGSTPFVTKYSGRDSYGFEYDAVNSCIRVTQQTAAGGNAGSDRDDHVESAAGGGVSRESWSKDSSQVPAQGVNLEDAGASTSLIDDALALDTDDVTLG